MNGCNATGIIIIDGHVADSRGSGGRLIESTAEGNTPHRAYTVYGILCVFVSVSEASQEIEVGGKSRVVLQEGAVTDVGVINGLAIGRIPVHGVTGDQGVPHAGDHFRDLIRPGVQLVDAQRLAQPFGDEGLQESLGRNRIGAGGQKGILLLLGQRGLQRAVHGIVLPAGVFKIAAGFVRAQRHGRAVLQRDGGGYPAVAEAAVKALVGLGQRIADQIRLVRDHIDLCAAGAGADRSVLHRGENRGGGIDGVRTGAIEAPNGGIDAEIADIHVVFGHKIIGENQLQVTDILPPPCGVGCAGVRTAPGLEVALGHALFRSQPDIAGGGAAGRPIDVQPSLSR